MGHPEKAFEIESGILNILLNKSLKDSVMEEEIRRLKSAVLSKSAHLQTEDVVKQSYVESIGEFLEEKLKGFMHNIKKFEKFNLYDTVIHEVEKALILMVLRETKGNQVKAAKLLGINRNTLRGKINKLRIDIKS